MKKKQEDKLQQILDIGIALSSEKNSNRLFDYIIETAMEMTGSDGGTLYIVEDNSLKFKIMKTKSKGIDMGREGSEIDIPPVQIKKENICGYAALTKESLNIENVYESSLFDFSGPKKYDELNDYHTHSMLAVPMIDHDDEVIGVMQLINAMDDSGNVRAYTQDEERILLSITSLAAIALSNMSYIEEIHQQIWSFTEAFTEAIDERTPYNGSHTRKVAKYAGLIADKINAEYLQGREEIFFTPDHREALVMAAYLHDIGKMIVPIEVMNKETRLGKHLEIIKNRLEIIHLNSKIDYLENKISEEEYSLTQNKVLKTIDVIAKADAAGFLNDDLYKEITEVLEYSYTKSDGEEEKFFKEDEKECLLIRKGTLTEEERKIMESHVEMTEKILSKVHFNKKYIDTPVWAAQHHERLNGQGYPKHLSGDELGIEVRILAVADICDALLASDRPYKKPMPKEKAFDILNNMADEGMIEKRFVDYLNDCI